MNALCTAVLVGLTLFLSGCSTLGSAILGSQTVKDDFAATSANFEQAVKLGLLAETDPAVTCTRAVIARAAADVTFSPQIDGLMSLGSTVYIAARAAEKRMPLPIQCDQVLGRVMIDGAKRIAR